MIPARRRRCQPTIRTRLTLIYGATFTVAVAALLGVIYLIMSEWPQYVFGETAPDGGYTVPHGGDLVPQPAVLARPTVGSESDLLASLLQASALTLAIGALVALGIGWLVAGRMLAPISRISAIAARIVAGSLSERIALAGPSDELKELGDTLDGMLARLEAAFEAQRRFAANASHELLTPLATSQAMLEVAAARPAASDVPELIRKLLVVNRRSEEIVDSLLLLARADQGELPTCLVELGGLGESAVEQLRAEALERSVTVRAAIEPVLVSGDAALLGRIVTNLLGNAIRHNRRGGTADIVVRPDAAGATLTVTNSGPAVPADRIDELFEPFVRADARTGTVGHGLGLPIVRAVTAAYGGVVTAVPNPGGGLIVTVRLARSD